MYYLALLWNESDPSAKEQARHLARRMQAHNGQWRIAFEAEDLTVYVTAPQTYDIDRAYILEGKRGVILGQLFERCYGDRSGVPPAIEFDGARSRSVVADRGRNLVERYWGRYVAFLRDPESRSALVVRDPTGAIPCQWAQLGSVHSYFVRIEDCELLEEPTWSIDRQYLLGYLLYDSVCVRRTGLSGVETVLPGECIEHCTGSRQQQLLWNPLEFARRDAIEEKRAAVDAMRSTVRACVHAWASRTDGILLDLSGGLDSSIVLSCLADAPTHPRVVAQHSYGEHGDLDEREYARLAATGAGCTLVERQQNPQFELPSLDSARRAVSPFPSLFESGAEQRELEFMQSHGLRVRFTGNGGDEVFYRSGPLPTAVDFTWRHRIHRQLFAVAIDDAVAARLSFWRIMQLVWRYGWLKHPWHPRLVAPPNHLPLLTDQAREEARNQDKHWHPLFRGSIDLEPNKMIQAYLLTFGAAHGYVPRTIHNYPPYIEPLLSQPLTELTLRIPVYALMYGGRDRALARDAFASAVPPAIIRRKSKGFGNCYVQDILTHHMGHARELLLDGYLVQAGILDRKRLAEALSGNLTRLPANVMEIASYLDVERWVRSWSGSRARIAA